MKPIKNFFDPESPKRHIIVTHEDMDGAGCACRAVLALWNTSEYHSRDIISIAKPSAVIDTFRQIVEVSPDQIDNTAYLITDLGINMECVQYLDDHGFEWYLIDHHRIDDSIRIRENVIHSTEYSAAFLTHLVARAMFKLYIPDAHIDKHSAYNHIMTRFCYWISQYDTGKWGHWNFDNGYDIQDPATCSLAILLQFVYSGIGFNRFIMENMVDLTDINVGIIYNDDAHIDQRIREYLISKYQNEIDRAIVKLQVSYNIYRNNGQNVSFNDPSGKRSYHVYMTPFDVPLFSLISKKFLEEHPEIDFVMAIDAVSGTGSLRTAKDDINLSDIAKTFGGGGHPKAAGFPIDRVEYTTCVKSGETKTILQVSRSM